MDPRRDTERERDDMAARARELREKLVKLSNVRWNRVERIRQWLREGGLDTDEILDETADAVINEGTG